MASVKRFAKEKGMAEEEQVLGDKEFKERVLREMNEKAKENNLSSLEKVKKVHLTMEPFTVENDLITPTFKIKRNVAKKVFQKEFDQMYAEPLT